VELTTEQQKALDLGIQLPLMEEFYTIQGEGFHSGKPAYFVRIGGCDVGCHWCDVKESWNAALHPLTKVDDVIVNILQHPAKAVVITGGEPSMYNLSYFTQQLIAKNIATFIETSGAYTLTGEWAWVCLSPKKTSPPLAENFSKAHELKVIVHNKDDFEWAEKNAQFVGADCKLFLQPEWSKIDTIMPLIVDYVMAHPQWNVSLQTHKYMKIP
jgi:7-carboxy-7-deazaguanine synthase